jgi:hypothetical protein
MGARTDTVRYTRDRERIRGLHRRLSVYAEIAAAELLEELGPDLAMRWALEAAK